MNTYPLTLSTGTNLNGEWQGSWTVDDDYLYNYKLILEASAGTADPVRVEITLR